MRRGILILGMFALAALLGLGLMGSPAVQAGPPAQAATTPTAGGAAPTAAGAPVGTSGTPVATPTGGEQRSGTPIGGGSAGATTAGGLVTIPADTPGQDPNLAVGCFLPICLSVGIIAALIGAFIATSRDARRARRIANSRRSSAASRQ